MISIDLFRLPFGLLTGMPVTKDLETVIQNETNQKKEKKKTLYINTFMWNLEKWYTWTYLQGRKTDRHREQPYGQYPDLSSQVRGINWETGTDIYILLYMKQITNENLLYSTYSVLCGDLNGKEIQREEHIELVEFAIQQKLKQHCKATILQ